MKVNKAAEKKIQNGISNQNLSETIFLILASHTKLSFCQKDDVSNWTSLFYSFILFFAWFLLFIKSWYKFTFRWHPTGTLNGGGRGVVGDTGWYPCPAFLALGEIFVSVLAVTQSSGNHFFCSFLFCFVCLFLFIYFCFLYQNFNWFID